MNEQKIINKQLIKNMLLNLITFTLIFSVLGIIIYIQVNNLLYNSSDQELLNNKNRLGIMQDFRENNPLRELTENVEEETETEERRIRNENIINPRLVYIFRDEDGNVIEETGKYNNDYFEEVKFDKNNIDTIYETTVNESYQYRGINYEIEDVEEAKYVQVLINVDAEQTIMKDFTKTLILSTIVCIALSIIASYILSKRTLKPIVTSWKKQTEFVQNASHELRTPLTILQAKQELLLEEPNSKIVDKAEEINICLNETRRLSKLVKDLISLARADSNKEELKKEKIDIDELIRTVSEPFKEIAEQQGKKLEIDLNYKKQISADRNKIHQVLIIILDNSIKYTEKGDSIIIRTEEKDNKFVLNIIDTGIGISDEGLKYVFDRFYREDKARSRQTGGSGLGLSIAYFIIEQHKGTINAFHNKPKGTRFEIKL